MARQACDACRLRKTKCDLSSAMELHASKSGAKLDELCKACQSVGIPCTFNLPVKKRGPPIQASRPVPQRSRSRHLAPKSHSSTKPSPPFSNFMPHSPSGEQSSLHHSGLPHDGINQLQQGSPNLSLLSSRSPLSDGNGSSSSDSESSHSLEYKTDIICHRTLFRRMMQDYLDLLYPLVPVIHRPTFLQDLQNDRDSFDPGFLSLVVAICAALIGTIPRKFFEYQRFSNPICFTSRKQMVDSCYNVILGLRKADYFDEPTQQKWATAYLLKIATYQVGRSNRAPMLLAEVFQMARLLKLEDPAKYEGVSYIEIQLRKKAFWLTLYPFIHYRVGHLIDPYVQLYDEETLNSINLDDMWPLEVDDEFIMEKSLLPQPPGVPSLAKGFNAAANVFWVAAILPSRDMGSFFHSARFFPSEVLASAKSRLHNLNHALDSVDTHLGLWSTRNEETTPFKNSNVLFAQFESMRANIHVSHLWLKSMLFEQILALEGSTLVQTEQQQHWQQREDICSQLLSILYNIKQVNLEPNGYNIPSKIRSVAITLLDCPFEQRGDISIRANAYIKSFITILARLDGTELNGKTLGGAECWSELNNHSRSDILAFSESVR